MSPTFLGATAAFFTGLAVALLVSYVVPEHSLYVCFVALFFWLAACLAAAWAVVLHATRTERVRAERVIDLTVDRMLKRRGLEIVDDL